MYFAFLFVYNPKAGRVGEGGLGCLEVPLLITYCHTNTQCHAVLSHKLFNTRLTKSTFLYKTILQCNTFIPQAGLHHQMILHTIQHPPILFHAPPLITLLRHHVLLLSGLISTKFSISCLPLLYLHCNALEVESRESPRLYSDHSTAN